jgi:ribonuclease BN (tRNA processing enzyme)
MRLTVIGCGDAFCSGSRFHSCYILDTSCGRFMIDCGANAPLGLKRAGVAVSSIDAILITHCHGDHFGGLPFLFLDKMFIDRAPTPLRLYGPAGFQYRMDTLLEALYPGIANQPRSFETVHHELEPGKAVSYGGTTISAFEVEHLSGSPSLALHIEGDQRRFSFSGDSGWCPGVIQVGREADLYLVECTTFSTKTTMHLDYLTLASKFDEIGAKRYLLTHMGEEMLAAAGQVDMVRCLLAWDGLSVEI